MKQQNRIKDLRESKGWSRTQLAARLELRGGESTVRAWELPGSAPSRRNQEKLAAVFGVSIDYLLGRTDQNRVDLPTLFAAAEEDYGFQQLYKRFNDIKDEVGENRTKLIKATEISFELIVWIYSDSFLKDYPDDDGYNLEKYRRAIDKIKEHFDLLNKMLTQHVYDRLLPAKSQVLENDEV